MSEQLKIQKQKLTQIFSFLKSFDALQKPMPRDIAQNPEVIDLSSIPENANLRLSLDENTVLRVRKPVRPILKACPSPPPELLPYLEPGWEIPKNVVELASALEDPQLIETFKKWEETRLSWKSSVLKEQQIFDSAAAFYSQAFRIYTSLAKDSEDLDLVLADNLLLCPNVNYPLVFQKLEIELEDKTAEFVFDGLVSLIVTAAAPRNRPALNERTMLNGTTLLDGIFSVGPLIIHWSKTRIRLITSSFSTSTLSQIIARAKKGPSFRDIGQRLPRSGSASKTDCWPLFL
jgi:hypothetical protein